MPDQRLLKTVHNWSERYSQSWEGRVTKIANQLNIANVINDETLSIRFALESVERILCIKDSENWNKHLEESDKLRTYKKYKAVLKKEWY